jgi:hypothetical protein
LPTHPALVAIEAAFSILLATYQGGTLVEPKLLGDSTEHAEFSAAVLRLSVQ